MTEQIDWDIRLEGRVWEGEQARARYELTPEKFEMWQGKLFWDDEQRLALDGVDGFQIEHVCGNATSHLDRRQLGCVHLRELLPRLLIRALELGDRGSLP